MLHRIINWITGPFKKKEEVKADAPATFTLTNSVPLSETTKQKIREDLIEAVKEFKEKHSQDLDTLPLSRVSEKAKEKIANLVKEDLKDRKLPNLEHQVVITETPKTKKKRYYKKKLKATNNEAPVSNTKTTKKSSK